MADYAISNVPRRVVYAASGTGPYAFTFEILNQTDIAVYKASTLLTLTTDYTVTINANGTGSVTLVLTAGTSNITIVGAKNIQRTTDFTTGGDLFANTLNDELDNQTIFIQQVAETAERGLKAPVVDPTDINMTLPAKASRVGTVLAFNATTGNPEAGPSIGSVTTVAAQSANINTVATNIASVNTVAGNVTNVNTVAGISSNVSAVAGSISNVNTVADDLNEPTSEINTVAVDIANVNNVGNNISNVNTVAGVSAGVTTVAGISSNVTTVAGVAAGVTTVAGISSNVTTVAGISANVTTVAGISGNVTTVATNNTNVTTVAGSIANVNIVGNNIANVNQVAADTTVINSASANAATATTKAAEALASANSASASAAAASAVALGNEPVRHSVRPSLLLDFANTKTLDPRITYTRASAGTYYDGKTVAKAEENLFQYSQEFDNAYWTKQNSTVTANSTAAPDGTTTADSLVEDVFTAVHRVGRSSVASGVTGVFTFSFFAKANTRSRVVIALSDSVGSGNVNYACFNLSTGVFDAGATTAGSGWSSASVNSTALANSWYLVSITATRTTSGNVAGEIQLDAGTSGTFNNSYAGNGTSGIFIWGAQLEQRSSVTAYQVTTTAAITNYIPALQSAAAGVARFEHNPTTGESLGLEIEEQRTNLLTRSDDFATTWVAQRATVTSNTIIAPDGTLTGDKLIADTTASNTHSVYQTVSVTSGTAYTFSAYGKIGELNRLALRTGSAGFTDAATVFNLSDGTSATATGYSAPTSVSMTVVGNGWYRCTITASATSTTTANPYVGVSNGNNIAFTGDGYAGIYIWGAQLEAGAFSTSYVPTVASQVTRSADSASMTGTNFSSWYNNQQGTVYIENTFASIASQTLTSFMISTGNQITNSVNLYQFAGTNAANIRTTGGVNTNFGSYTVVQNTYYKYAVSWQANSQAISRNGGAVATAAVGIPNNLDTFSIANGNIKKFAFYPARLTNAELQGLTTN
jgi:hypothetical protein